jgi:hypothetical protein
MLAERFVNKRVAVVGSRGFRELAAVDEFISKLPESATVVSGGAGGVDTRAVRAARSRGLTTVEFRADWNKHGKAAGMIRNGEIVNAADYVVAFWDASSNGTKDTMRKTLKAGKPLAVYAKLQDTGCLLWLATRLPD